MIDRSSSSGGECVRTDPIARSVRATGRVWYCSLIACSLGNSQNKLKSNCHIKSVRSSKLFNSRAQIKIKVLLGKSKQKMYLYFLVFKQMSRFEIRSALQSLLRKAYVLERKLIYSGPKSCIYDLFVKLNYNLLMSF